MLSEMNTAAISCNVEFTFQIIIINWKLVNNYTLEIRFIGLVKLSCNGEIEE